MDAYLSVTCSLPSALEDELPTVLFEIPFLGTEITRRGDDRADVTVFFADAQADRVDEITRLIIAAGGDVLEIRIVDHEDWMTNYRRMVTPFEVGSSWWIDPHPNTPTPAPAGRKRLVVPPRMAFGSGSHESTSLLLHALETTVLGDGTVLDVGTGSGILALACDALGAHRVLGVDVDAVAIRIAREICDLQEWRPAVHFVIGSAGCAAPGSFDVVLCNMISAHFMPLLGAMAEALAPGGRLLLSGFLRDESAGVHRALDRCGLVTTPLAALGDWACLCAGRSA